MLTFEMQSLQENGVSRLTFGLFEADLKTGELWKAGHRVRLQALPFRVLKVLLQNSGEIVTREELQASVWGPDVVVDFEHALSNAIKKLREAPGDSAENPRFVETLARRGFRFIAPVGVSARPASTASQPVHLAALPATGPLAIAVPASVQTATRAWLRGPVLYWYFGASLILVLSAFIAGSAIPFRTFRQQRPAQPRISQITQDGTIYAPKVLLLGTLSAIVTDGVHLFTPLNENGHVVLSRVSVSTGSSQTVPLPSQIGVPEIEDISSDGSHLLLRSNLAAASQQPLWIVPVEGGSAFRVSDVVAQSATWMPDAKGILYSSGNQLSVVSLDSGKSTPIATVPGTPFWPRWSPGGKLLRFTIIDTVNHTSSLWEISKGQTNAHPILRGWDGATSVCCGVWTAEGRHFVFEATRDGTTDLWELGPSPDSGPVRLTNGPLNFKAASPASTGGRIFFVGQDIRSRLERFDPEQKQYNPVQGFLSAADHVSYSRDGHWVAWIDADGRLWRARNDGTERVLLTAPSMQVFMASWSPDNSRVAFMARVPNQPWQIYTVRADGGTPERLVQENRNLGDPSYSADGRYIVFGVIPELMGKSDRSSSLWLMDVATHRVTAIAHSDGMYSPKWSPDGRYIAALTLEQKQLMLYDTTNATWKALAATAADHPFWANDSRAVFLRIHSIDNKPIYRVSIPDGHMTEIADLTNFRVGSITLADFSGLSPDNLPLMHAEISNGNLYTLSLK